MSKTTTPSVVKNSNTTRHLTNEDKKLDDQPHPVSVSLEDTSEDDPGPVVLSPQSDQKTTTTVDRGKCMLSMMTKRCLTHDCDLMEVKVSAVRWEYQPKKKCYGNVRRKVSKWNCMEREKYPKVLKLHP